MQTKQGLVLVVGGLVIVGGIVVGYQYLQRTSAVDNQQQGVNSIQQQIVAPNPTPASKTEFSLNDASQIVTLKWDATTPKAGESVAYRIKVWQLMQGQNGTQAMKSNQPIITKDVIGSTQTTVAGIYTGPCKPPYLCDFIWDVQAIVSTSPAAEVKASTGATIKTSTAPGAR